MTFFYVILLTLVFNEIVSNAADTSVLFSLPRPVPTQGVPSSKCHVDYKVYVYEISPYLLQPSIEARRNLTYHICQKCIFEQFALEFVVMDYFTQFCGRTMNPDEADYFYLPLTRDLDYRISMTTGKGKVSSPLELMLLDVIEKNDFTRWQDILGVTDEYWKRKNGTDHVIVMPAPVTNFRHQSNMRGFFHYMPQLASPIFFNVEFSRNFVTEYPICGKEKNLVMPYPTTDPELFSQRYYNEKGDIDPLTGRTNIPVTMTRSRLVFYHGGFHGSCTHVRSALNDLMQNSKKFVVQRGDRKREQGFMTASFCPIPIGDSPSSKRMYDALNFGCIPVLLSDDALWAYSIQSGGPIDPALFSITLPQRTVQRTVRQLINSLKPAEGLQTNKSHPDVNWGKSLPLGTSVLSIIEAAAQEEDEIVANSTSIEKPRKLLDEKPSKRSKREKKSSFSKNGLGIVASNEELLQANALIKILLKIPPAEVRKLRENAYLVSHYYRFYEFNTSLSHSAPPLTATRTFPSGGGIEMMDKYLSDRKKGGVQDVWTRCQVELKQKHKYIGRYPCEQRRRLSLYDNSADIDSPCSRKLTTEEDSLDKRDREERLKFWSILEKEQYFATWNQIKRA